MKSYLTENMQAAGCPFSLRGKSSAGSAATSAMGPSAMLTPLLEPGRGADFAESFTGFVMDNRYKKITRKECRKLFVGSVAV